MFMKKHLPSLVLCLFYANVSFSQNHPEHGSRPYYDQQLQSHTSDLKAYVLLELDRLAQASSVSKLNAFLSALESTNNQDKEIILDVFKMVLVPDEDLEESYPNIYMIADLIGMGLDMSAEQEKIIENIFRSSELIRAELNAARIQNETYLKPEDMGKIISEPVTKEWDPLKEKDFRQGPEASSCALYSLLYAVKKHPKLRSIFREQTISSITKDRRGNYYVLQQDKPRLFKPSFLKAADPLMHPASSPIIKILGHLVIEKMEMNFPAFYVIADPTSGKDHLFERPILDLGRRYEIEKDAAFRSRNAALSQVVFKKDGTVLFHKENGLSRLSGDFVLSVATNKWGGHAVSVFFDQKTKTWKLYDNLRGVSKLSSKRLPEQVIQHIFAVGFWEIRPMSTRN